MTLLITMVTKKGIFMIADSLIVRDNNGLNVADTNMEKIIVFEEPKVSLSFWGTICNPNVNFDLSKELEEIKGEFTQNDTPITISKKLKSHFEKSKFMEYDDQLGFHVCGYANGTPYLHHVFHETWLGDNEFIDENAKSEFHQPLANQSGKVCSFQRVYKDNEFPMLFNGDNKIPNLIINGIRFFQDKVDYPNFDKNKAKEFLIFLMATAIKLQEYSEISSNCGKLIGYPLMLCHLSPTKITKEFISKESIPFRSLDEAQ